MSRTLQFKRYPAAVVANTTGANGELIIDTTNYSLTIHDGTTLGGYIVTSSSTDTTARTTANSGASYANGAFAQANAAFTVANTGITDAFARTTANAAFTSVPEKSPSGPMAIQTDD
jgi:hypothetical protein